MIPEGPIAAGDLEHPLHESHGTDRQQDRPGDRGDRQGEQCQEGVPVCAAFIVDHGFAYCLQRLGRHLQGWGGSWSEAGRS